MKSRVVLALASLAFSSCMAMPIAVTAIKDVYVADFKSDDIERCRPSDVDLTHREAHVFFERAKLVDSKTLHDHYNFAPCRVEGTLKYRNNSCDWEIRAGATGHIQCGDRRWYFACDTCEDLFEVKQRAK